MAGVRDEGSAVLRFFGMSDVGKKRTDNEDRFKISNEKQYCILADGMGGRLYGEVASSMAVEILAGHIEHDLPGSLRRLDRTEQAAMLINLMDDWIRDVNTAIHKKGMEDDRYQEMGTTLVCLVGLERQVVLSHVGDSRCYLWDKGVLTQVTEDHSFVNTQVKSGMLTEEEAKESRQRNIITRAVGTASKVKPEIKILQTVPAQRFLVCSDGLHDLVPFETISEIMQRKASLEKTSRTFVDAANEAGGRDNITVILAEVGE
jgi:protein phosphatase